MLGYEWTNWIHGHRHVLYFGPEGGEVLSSIDERYETPQQLWDALRGQDVLTFAHHSAGGPIATNWAFAPDPELEPVTEVASVHGASEASDAPERIYSSVAGNFVRDELDRGAMLGFIGSGDSHDGHPGLAHLVNPQMGGARGRAHARPLARRHPLGAEGAPLLRDQRPAHHPARRAGRPAHGHDRARRSPGVAALRARHRLRADRDTSSSSAPARSPSPRPGESHWDVETAFHPADLAAGEYLYVRIVQEDGGAAWSSPFFVR